jgi:hypothetical protein
MGYLHIILWKKMFCGKKVTKLPDLTVDLLWFLSGKYREEERRTIHYRLHTQLYVNCFSILFFWSRWELIWMPVPYIVCIYMCFRILDVLIAPVWKLNNRQAFLNPWPTLQHNMRMGGGGCLTHSQCRKYSTLTEDSLFLCTHILF